MNNIKIALLGNMNNNFFSLCRYLRDYGFDAHLLLMKEMEHFLPENDTFDENYKKYTYQTLWHKYYFFDAKLKKIIEDDIKQYDFLIGCDWSPAYLNLIDKKLDIFIPYGGDMITHIYPASQLNFIKQIYRLATFKYPINPNRKVAQFQINGIKNSKLIILEKIINIESVFNELFINSRRIANSIPMVYDIFKNMNKQIVIEKFNFIVQENKIIFISQIRHCWVSSNTGDPNKGNDIIIKSFHNFLKTYPNKAVLILFRYGTDVACSEKLIDDLGIQNNITWFPLTDRKHLMYMIKHSDLCIGHLGYSVLSYGSSLEPILAKTPLVHNYKDAMKDSIYDYIYNGFHASNEQELTDVMIKVYNKDYDREKMTEDSYKWYYDQLVNRFINTVKTEIERKYS